MTLAIDLIPPRMTAPMRPARARPKTSAEPSEPRKPSAPPVTSRAWAKVWLAWNMLPPPTPKKKMAMAKAPVRIVAGTRPNRSKATGRYLNGPPEIVPSSLTERYFTPSVHSANFVAMPSRPQMIIQNVAPAPPSASAAPTPAMLPRPTVPESAEDRAWKWVISPGSSSRENLPRTTSVASLKPRSWMRPKYAEMMMPAATSQITTIGSEAPPGSGMA